MNIEMVFNELSSVNLANDKFEARDLMSKLVITLQAAIKIGVSRSLKTQKEINSLELAPEYFCNWRIHFLSKTPGRVIIGYVGTHLPTTRYPT